MAQGLPEDSIDSQNMLKNFIEYHDRNIELLLIEDFQSSFNVFLQFSSINRNIVLGKIITEQNGSFESRLAERWEISGSNLIN